MATNKTVTMLLSRNLDQALTIISTCFQKGKAAMIRRTAVRETGLSWHREEPLKPFEHHGSMVRRTFRGTLNRGHRLFF